MKRKLILVTTEWAPFSGRIKALLEALAAKHGVELEVREEDWVFLSKFGEEDELGGYDVPQIFVEEDGRVRHVLTRVPLSETGQPDFDEVARRVEEALK